MTFEKRNVHQHNSGYEFDITHETRGTMRFAAPTDDAREEFAEFAYYRSDADEGARVYSKDGSEGVVANFRIGNDAGEEIVHVRLTMVDVDV